MTTAILAQGFWAVTGAITGVFVLVALGFLLSIVFLELLLRSDKHRQQRREAKKLRQATGAALQRIDDDAAESVSRLHAAYWQAQQRIRDEVNRRS
ncbi:hypothetical protein [Nocardia nova]|uniref:hypothetical protein n=1 Tax=Nocardia nova TaxID=37330 RepID=UPI000CEA05C8|nr:hypothetical protein [Nocardia nova]PPJ23142.1 hypothetical protein C5E41_25470 [Nocardia nova]